MSIPKQDERTPGPWRIDPDNKMLVKSHFSTIVARCQFANGEANAAFIVQACNAYTSTEALRTALADLCDEATFLLDRLSEVDFTDLEYTVRDFDGHVEPSMARLRDLVRGIEARTALAGVTAPSEVDG